jgi:two-component system response regulator FlrC
VRELENVIQRALVLSEGARIESRDIDLGMTALDTRASELSARMLMAEGETILAALRAQGGKRLATAEALGISERTLRYKLRKLKDLGMEVT